MLMARTPPCCAECHLELEVVEHWSWYWARPLCPRCAHREALTPHKETEIRLLERMFNRSAS